MSSSNSNSSALSGFPSLKSFSLSFPAPLVLLVSISTNPVNSMTRSFWSETVQLFRYIATRTDVVRCVVLTGSDSIFTGGLDLKSHAGTFGPPTDGTEFPRKAVEINEFIKKYQETVSVLEEIPQPVIAAVHGPCIGGGVDLILAADIRVCSSSAYFSIKEVDIGMTADVGTLQRIVKSIGHSSLVHEWAYTGRKINSAEALKTGLVSSVIPSHSELINFSVSLGSQIASKSPLAVTGTKRMLNYSRDHSIANSLDYMALWNSSALQSEDMGKAFAAAMKKETPIFSKL